MTTNWLQQGSFIHQHPNPTSVPMNQFHQSQASVSTQQHSYPASMPTNQLQVKNTLSCVHMQSLEQQDRNAHDVGEQTIHTKVFIKT